jgi:hypothetical protein
MGTNYYFYPRNSPLDASIRILEQNNENNIHSTALEMLREAMRLHIGKSSGGWCFALHVTDGIRSLEDWKAKFSEGGVIRDEYDRDYTPEEMLRVITVRSRPDSLEFSVQQDPYYKSLQDFLDKNHAEIGPNNLLRSQIGHNCIGHGDGTWDLIKGEFS